MLKRSALSLCLAGTLLFIAGCDSSGSLVSSDEGVTEASESNNDPIENSPEDSSTDENAENESGTDTADGGPVAGGGDDAPATPVPSAPSESDATYSLTFEATWSADTHPLNFPADPHFSGLTGATHNGAVNFWQPGQLATLGFQNVAETGNRAVFIEEIRASVSAGTALQLIEGGGIPEAPGSVSVTFQISQQFPLLTFATMVAPSPDWVVGVHDLDLRGSDGDFVDSLVIDAIIYDAGTDSGLTYATANIISNPQEPITRLTSNSTDTNIVQGLPSAGRFILQKQ